MPAVEIISMRWTASIDPAVRAAVSSALAELRGKSADVEPLRDERRPCRGMTSAGSSGDDQSVNRLAPDRSGAGGDLRPGVDRRTGARLVDSAPRSRRANSTPRVGAGMPSVSTSTEVSRAAANRPDLDRLMADCRAGLMDAVIVEKIDRFGRSFRHGVALIGELEDLGIEFVCDHRALDDTPGGRLQRNFFCRSPSGNVSASGLVRPRVVSATARAGWWPAGDPPFGWIGGAAKDGKHKTTAHNPKEVAVWNGLPSA